MYVVFAEDNDASYVTMESFQEELRPGQQYVRNYQTMRVFEVHADCFGLYFIPPDKRYGECAEQHGAKKIGMRMYFCTIPSVAWVEERRKQHDILSDI